MQDIAVTAAVADAMGLIASADAGIVSGLGHALALSAGAALIAAVAGVVLGAALSLGRFPGRRALGAVAAALIALPPGGVVLVLAIAIPHASTPALAAALAVSAVPLVSTLARRALADCRAAHGETLQALRASPVQALATLLAESRSRLLAGALLGGLRVLAEAAAALVLAAVLAPRATTGLFPGDLASAPAMLASGLVLGALTAGAAALVLATLVLRDGRSSDGAGGRPHAA